MTDDRPRSETTARAVAFVAAHRDEAEGLGRSLADDVHDPEAFARQLEAGFARLADPEYQEVTAWRTGALTEAVLQATVPW